MSSRVRRFSQGDMVELPFYLPQGVLHHPGIILSSQEAIEAEDNAFLAVMLTTEKYDDEFTFEIEPWMFNKTLPNGYREARLQLVNFFLPHDVIPNRWVGYSLKKDYLNRLLTRMQRVTFGIQVP